MLSFPPAGFLAFVRPTPAPSRRALCAVTASCGFVPITVAGAAPALNRIPYAVGKYWNLRREARNYARLLYAQTITRNLSCQASETPRADGQCLAVHLVRACAVHVVPDGPARCPRVSVSLRMRHYIICRARMHGPPGRRLARLRRRFIIFQNLCYYCAQIKYFVPSGGTRCKSAAAPPL